MLTPEQIEKRRNKLTASRVGVLMRGDAAGILQLWKELVGEALPQDLSDNWAVQLGTCTEQLQLDWFERKNRMPVVGRGTFIQSSKLHFAGSTIDGWVEELKAPIEAKHCGGREPIETICHRYWPQAAWQMFCCEADQCLLSIIQGAAEPVIETLERDESYMAELIARAKEFWRFVEAREPPVDIDLPAIPPPAVKEYDMTGNNRWGEFAHQWLTTREAYGQCADAQGILKEMVPEDAKKCFGHGVQITRDRAGRLSLREFKDG